MSKTPYRIVTISGPSGAGKTTLVGSLFKHFGQKVELMQRFTTRSARADDNPGECIHVSFEEFKALEADGKLLYPVELNHYWHAMPKVQVDTAMGQHNSLLIADMSVQNAEKLHGYVGEGKVISIFLAHCPEEMLRERMRKRGESDVERRIIDGSPWQANAQASSVWFAFVDARQAKDQVVKDVLRLL